MNYGPAPNPQQAMAPYQPQGMAQMWHQQNVVLCKRKILAIAPTFEIFDPTGQRPIVFCQEKLFKIKDDIRIFSDSSKKVELLRIKQRNIMDWAGIFDVTDPANGQKLGAWKRKGWRSFARDEWMMCDANDQQVGRIIETGGAIWRRFFKFLPYTFDFEVMSQVVGTFDQAFTFVGYKATMDITRWQGAPVDRRMAFAGALLLMAIEAKEDASR
jgi:uncharacterized protein YxjI